MARTVHITVPASDTDRLLERLGPLEGAVSILVHRGVAHRPKGDLVVLRGTNDMAEKAVAAIADMDLVRRGAVAIDEPVGLISGAARRELDGDTSEACWEEMDTMLRQNTNPSRNYIALMVLSGAVAGAGLALDRLHIVVGAMLIAPGFEPLVRVSLGLVSGLADTARRGAASVAIGYGALIAGGALGSGLAVWAGAAPDLQAVTGQDWVGYWSTVQAPSVVVALLAGVAGAVVVNSHQTVFATGVMIALALVPAAAICGLGLLAGDPALALRGLGRWAVDAACVVATGLAVFAIKRGAAGRGASS